MRVTATPLPSLTAGAAGLPAWLSGAPWWAVLPGVAVITVSPSILTQIRAWSRDRMDRRFQEAFIDAVGQLPDPEKKVQAMIDYRRAEPSPGGPAEQAPTQDTPADPQGP